MSLAVRITGVPEHFNRPWHTALQRGEFQKAGYDVSFVNCPGGTGAMISSVLEGTADVAVALTEGIVAAIVNQAGASEQQPPESRLRYCGEYVTTPLRWMIVTGRGRQSSLDGLAGIRGALQQEGGAPKLRVSVSRLGSGSHLMAFLLARREGWRAEQLEFVVHRDFRSMRRAVCDGSADIFMWEWFMTKPFADAGELATLGFIDTPWHCFGLVARGGWLDEPRNRTALQDVCAVAFRSAARFLAEEDASCEDISAHYGLSLDDAHAWMRGVGFARRLGVVQGMIDNVVGVLASVGVIGSELDPGVLVGYIVDTRVCPLLTPQAPAFPEEEEQGASGGSPAAGGGAVPLGDGPALGGGYPPLKAYPYPPARPLAVAQAPGEGAAAAHRDHGEEGATGGTPAHPVAAGASSSLLSNLILPPIMRTTSSSSYSNMASSARAGSPAAPASESPSSSPPPPSSSEASAIQLGVPSGFLPPRPLGGAADIFRCVRRDSSIGAAHLRSRSNSLASTGSGAGRAGGVGDAAGGAAAASSRSPVHRGAPDPSSPGVWLVTSRDALPSSAAPTDLRAWRAKKAAALGAVSAHLGTFGGAEVACTETDPPARVPFTAASSIVSAGRASRAAAAAAMSPPPSPAAVQRARSFFAAAAAPSSPTGDATKRSPPSARFGDSVAEAGAAPASPASPDGLDQGPGLPWALSAAITSHGGIPAVPRTRRSSRHRGADYGNGAMYEQVYDDIG